MSRRKRYIRGKVYLINDNLIVKNNKPNRRVVAVKNNQSCVYIKRITKISNGGRNARKGTPIEKYPDIPLPSAVENKTFKKTVRGKLIKERLMKKTKTRLNKWDMKSI